jgi:hypothetical protein
MLVDSLGIEHGLTSTASSALTTLNFKSSPITSRDKQILLSSFQEQQHYLNNLIEEDCHQRQFKSSLAEQNLELIARMATDVHPHHLQPTTTTVQDWSTTPQGKLFIILRSGYLTSAKNILNQLQMTSLQFTRRKEAVRRV